MKKLAAHAYPIRSTGQKASIISPRWRAPAITASWWPVFLRNLLVWRKLFWPSLIGNIAEPLIWLVAFGYGMGALVGQVTFNGQTVPYLLFLASGSICMSAMQAASFEALYSAFSRMQMQKTWEGIMNAPVGLDDIVFAETMWAAFKALFTVSIIMVVMLLLGIGHHWTLLLAWPVLLLVGITFSCIAMIFTALAKGYDFFTYYFTLFLTPMMFLSGVFFPREQLPGWVQAIAQWLPLGVAIDMVRPLFMGQLPATPWRNLSLLTVTAAVSFWLAMALVRKRFRG
jgi:lipooligosaccharide transport system permease protein